MIRSGLESWLQGLFEMKVVQYIGQARDEKVLYYSIENSPITTRTAEAGMVFSYECTVIIREPNGVDLVGFLTWVMFDEEGRSYENFEIENDFSDEIVETVNTNQRIISRSFRVTQKVPINKVREHVRALKAEYCECEGGNV